MYTYPRSVEPTRSCCPSLPMPLPGTGTVIGIDRFSRDRYNGADYKGSYRVPFRKIGKQRRFPPAARKIVRYGQWRPPASMGQRTFFLLTEVRLHGTVGIDGEVREEWAGGGAQWRARRQRRRSRSDKGVAESPIG